MKFKESNAFKSETDYTVYDAQHLIFNKKLAWCLSSKSSLSSTDPYHDWATIDLARKYLIHGMQVGGFLEKSTDPLKRKYIADMFKFRYSLNGEVRKDFEERKV